MKMTLINMLVILIIINIKEINKITYNHIRKYISSLTVLKNISPHLLTEIYQVLKNFIYI